MLKSPFETTRKVKVPLHGRQGHRERANNLFFQAILILTGLFTVITIVWQLLMRAFSDPNVSDDIQTINDKARELCLEFNANVTLATMTRKHLDDYVRRELGQAFGSMIVNAYRNYWTNVTSAFANEQHYK